MQITNSLLSGVSNDPGFGRTATKAGPRPAGPAQDQVQLSSLASRNLSELQASYEAGTYNVSPSQIANSIMNDAMR